ncbi:hypothetical protein HanIR_Chr11g0560631 [Helianthus annuus]|nr:hypothetical protein HanIR_Chr11g0560631 [Helianthus annuus]
MRRNKEFLYLNVNLLLLNSINKRVPIRSIGCNTISRLNRATTIPPVVMLH